MTFQVARWCGLGGLVPDYEQLYALYLNVPDGENRECFREFTVHTAAAPGGALPYEWLEAAIPNPVEATRWKNWDLRRSLSRLK
jgi:hypothetical protein